MHGVNLGWWSDNKEDQISSKDQCIKKLEKHCRVVIGEDEVIMKKDVEEKYERSRRLVEGGLEIQQDEIVMKRAHVET